MYRVDMQDRRNSNREDTIEDNSECRMSNKTNINKLPAHLALLRDIDNEIETLENDIEITPEEPPETRIHDNPHNNSIFDDDSSTDMKLAKLLQPDLIPPGRRYLRCHVLISVVQMLTLSSFMAVRGLIVSLHSEMGLYALSLYYSWYALTSVMVASKLNGLLGPRGTVVLSIVCHLLFLISNFLDCHVTLLLGCGLAGVGSALIYAAQSTYEKSLTVMYTSCTGANLIKISALFASLTRLFSHGSIVLGNLISSIFILHLAPYINNHFNQIETVKIHPARNISASKCDFWCQMEMRPSQATLLFMYSVLGGLIVLAMTCLVCFLVRLDVVYRTKSSGELCQPAVLGVFMMFVQPKLLLMLGVAAYLAYVQALLYGEFLKLFISCRLGVGYIGYILVTYSVMNCASSALTGPLRNCLGRMTVNIAGLLVSCGVLVTLYTWDTESTLSMAYFLLFGGLGASDGLLNTQLEVTIWTICRHQSENPLTLVKVMQAAVVAVCLSTSSLTCPGTRLLLAFGLLGLALGTSLAMEGMRDRKRRMTSSVPV